MREVRRILVFLVAVATLFLVLTLLIITQTGRDTRASAFNPSFSKSVSDSGVEAAADVMQSFSLSSPDSYFSRIVAFTPDQWGVATDAEVPNGAKVGSFEPTVFVGLLNTPCNMPFPMSFELLDATTNTAVTVTHDDGFLDANSNGLPDAVDKYPVYLTTLFPGQTPRARYYGQTVSGGANIAINFPVFDPGQLAGFPSSLGYAEVTVVQDPTSPPSTANPFTDICTPASSTKTIFGASQNNPATAADESGFVIRRNPSVAGSYAFSLDILSLLDFDNDGIENQMDTCLFVVNLGSPRIAASGDADQDGLDVACDPNDEQFISDQDGDGFSNRHDNCPLVFNPIQAESEPLDSRDGIGDACDPNPTVPDGHDHALTLTDSVSIITPESVSEAAPAGGTVTSDTEADGATASDPVETSVTTPNAGTVSIEETSITEPTPTGFQLLGQQVNISAPTATTGDPLVIVFRIDSSLIPPGEDETTIQLFKDGLPVFACTGAPGVASPDPCVSNRALLGDGDVEITVLTSSASAWNFAIVLDTDGDGWSDAAEVIIGTDPFDGCADTSTPNDERGPGFGEPLSPLPPDLNDDRFMDITDIVAVAGSFGLSAPPALARLDVAPKAAPDGFVDITDIVAVAGLFGQSCV